MGDIALELNRYWLGGWLVWRFIGFIFRLINTIKGRLSMTHDEETFQELLALTCKERSRVRARRGGHISKEQLMNKL